MNTLQTQVFGLPKFEVNNSKDIWANEKGIKVDVPGVFEYRYGNGIKQSLYEGDDLNLYDINGNLVEEEIDDSNLIQKREVVTKLDLLNFQGLNNNQIEELLNKEIFTKEEKEEGLSLNSPEGISKLNDLFRGGYQFLSTLGRKVPDKYSNFSMFGDKEEIINFCKITQNKGTKDAYINCLLSKASFVVSDIINNKALEYLSKKEEVLVSILKFREEFHFYGDKGYLEIYGEKINFSLVSRAKGKLSSQLKMGKDPSYYSSTIMDDGVGLTFYIENKEDSTIFLEHINKILFDEDNVKIETKGNFINPENNKWKNKIKYFLDDIIIKKSRDSTNDDYGDLKSKGPIPIPNSLDEYNKGIVGENVKTEIKVVNFDSKNDDGLSFQPIYGYFKYIEVLIRFLQGYIEISEIQDTIDLFFFNLDEKLEEKNKLMPNSKEKTKEEYLIELEEDLIKGKFIEKGNSNRKAKLHELKNGLKEYYINKLIKVKVGKRKGIFLTTPREYNLSLAGYRQRMELIH